MTPSKDITVTLKLSTDPKYGNSTGQQVDTLAVAVNGADCNDAIDNCIDWFNQTEQSVLENYSFTDDFLATLTPDKARKLHDNVQEYENGLAQFTEELQEKARSYELDDSHPLAKELQSARDDVYKELRHDWLYGDYRGNFDGIIRLAKKRYGLDLEFNYDEKTDTITVTVPTFLAQEWRDDGNIDKVTKNDIRYYLTNIIENDAEVRHSKELAERKKRHEEYTVRANIKREREAREEEERKAKLQQVITKK